MISGYMCVKPWLGMETFLELRVFHNTYVSVTIFGSRVAAVSLGETYSGWAHSEQEQKGEKVSRSIHVQSGLKQNVWLSVRSLMWQLYAHTPRPSTPVVPFVLSRINYIKL